MLELYDARKEAKDYLEFYLTPDSNAELEKRKKAIRQEFFPTPNIHVATDTLHTPRSIQSG